MKKLAVAMMAAMAATCVWAAAAFSYQGRLMDANGTAALTGNKTVQIRLYNVASGGTPLWGRAYSVLLDSNGIFNAEVSDSTGSALSGTSGYSLEKVFTLNATSTIYVGVTVQGSSGEISPRQKLLAVPYATFASDVSQAKSDFTVAGTLTAKNMTISQGLTASSINVTGSVGASTLTTTGDATVKGNLTVNGTIKGIGTVPVNGIIMWSGSSVPDGWALCDGSNGTPDLRGRFIVGAGQGYGLSYYSMGARGGEEYHRLTIAEMPSHWHNNRVRTVGYTGSFNGSAEAATYDGYEKNNGHKDISGSNTGGDQSHENRPPYYALAFIMRIR